MNKGLRNMAVVAIAMLISSNLAAQTWKPDYATQLLLPSITGSGPDITKKITIVAPDLTTAASWTMTLPTTAGTSGYVLATDGAGHMSWASVTTAGSEWNIAGNTGTTAGTNFIGTTDAVDLVFKANSTEQLRIKSGGAINVAAFSTAGVVHNLAGGNLASSLIVNADVDAAAAIAGTKISPDFGSQAIRTTNSIGTGDATTAGGLVIYDGSSHFGAISAVGISSSRTYSLPDASGTFALQGGPGSFTTLTSTGSTTLGTTNAATANTFGTGADNTVAISNTIGNSNAGSVTTINGGVTLSKLTAVPGVVHNDASGVLSTGAIVTSEITNANVTYGKIQNVAASSLFGNPTAGATTGTDIGLDATLKFTGSPLKLAIDLSNGNSWTGVQTFLTTAPQSDAFVSSINGGGTSTVNVTHGGTGLGTYAAGDLIYASAANTLSQLGKGAAGQVLTMNSAGTFPQWGNAGATITMGVSSDVTGTSITLDNQTSLYMLNPTASYSLTSISGGTTGRLIVLVNKHATNTVTIATGGNFTLQGGGSIILGQNGTATLVYDGTNWRVIANY